MSRLECPKYVPHLCQLRTSSLGHCSRILGQHFDCAAVILTAAVSRTANPCHRLSDDFDYCPCFAECCLIAVIARILFMPLLRLRQATACSTLPARHYHEVCSYSFLESSRKNNLYPSRSHHSSQAMYALWFCNLAAHSNPQKHFRIHVSGFWAEMP